MRVGLFKTRGFRPPTAPYSFTGLKEYAEKGLPLAWSTLVRISGVINYSALYENGMLIRTGFRRKLRAMVLPASVSAPAVQFPLQVKKPAREGAAIDQAPLLLLRTSDLVDCSEAVRSTILATDMLPAGRGIFCLLFVAAWTKSKAGVRGAAPAIFTRICWACSKTGGLAPRRRHTLLLA